ncbi:MAG: hypothetical protein QM698_12505 [Micropepsaceae bacterium]
MEAIGSIIVGILMLVLPQGWVAATPAKCEQVPVLHGPPGATSEECRATYARGEAELTVIVWRPVVPRDGGPMVSVEDSKGKLLGQDVMVSRTSQFMGFEQEVLVTSVELPKAGAHVLIYASNTSLEDFQAVLDGVSLAE